MRVRSAAAGTDGFRVKIHSSFVVLLSNTLLFWVPLHPLQGPSHIILATIYRGSFLI
jgi:hypothetical protein